MGIFFQFERNLNNKLNGAAFTVMAPRADEKYKIGEMIRMDLGTAFYCWGRIIDIKHFHLQKINDYISYLDMGLNREEGIKYITEKYPGR